MRFARHLAWISTVGGVLAWCFAASRSSQVAPSVPTLPRLAATASPLALKDERIEFEGTYSIPDSAKVLVTASAPGHTVHWLVKPGDHVVKGQVIAEADPASATTLGSRRVDGKAESIHAEKLSEQLGTALSGHEAAVRQAQGDLAKSEADRSVAVSAAKTALDRVTLGTPPDRLNQAQHDLDQAKATRDKAKALSDRDQHAYEEGWVSRNQATASKAAFDASDGLYQKALSHLQELRRGPTQAEIEAATREYERVKASQDQKVQEAADTLSAIQNGGLAFGASSPVTLPSGAPIAGRIAPRVLVKSPADGIVLPPAGPAPANAVTIVLDGSSGDFTGLVEATRAERLRVGMVVRLSQGELGTVNTIGPTDPRSGLVPVHVECQPKLMPGGPTKAVIVIRSADSN